MPLIFEDDNHTREDLDKLRRQNSCKDCGAHLNVYLDGSGRAFLACWDWLRTHHQGGYERQAQDKELNIVTRREMMEQQLGRERATKLVKYEGVVSLTKSQAMEILGTIWPEAPEVEVIKAAMVCAQYGLNPLMRHIFLIPFKKRNKKGEVVGEEWAIVRGIGADRLLARRRHNYSYLDLTPRRMTEEEQKKVNGEVDNTKLWAITLLKDIDTGAQAMGVASWPIDEMPYGAEKGNTKLNMACIRSERQALDRQYPGEMPQGIEVIDEKYITNNSLISPPEGGEKIGGLVEEEAEERGTATTIFSPPKQEQSPKIGASAEPEIQGQGFHLAVSWLEDTLQQLKWTEDTTKSFLSKYKVSLQGSLPEVIKRLTREQAEDFTGTLQEKLAQKQRQLF